MYFSIQLLLYWIIVGSKKYVYISNHPNNAREVNKICAILKKYDVECTISKYRTLAEIDNDVMHRLTEDLSIATHHLVFLSRDYIQDEFCQFGKYPKTTKIDLNSICL